MGCTMLQNRIDLAYRLQLKKSLKSQHDFQEVDDPVLKKLNTVQSTIPSATT